MSAFQGQPTRRFWLGVIVASCLGALPLGASAEGGTGAARGGGAGAPSAVAVFVPRAPVALRSVEGGVRLWLIQELRQGGIPAVDPGHTDRVAAARISQERPFLRGEDAPALASAAEASAVVLGRMKLEDGGVEIWLRAYDAKGEPLAVGRGSGRLASLGDALVASFGPLRSALGAGRSPGNPPRLDELGAYQRTMERIAAGSLALAWRELEGIESPTADALRDDILTLSAGPDVEALDRSKLASARGANDPDWLTIRHRLQGERDADALVAGAERSHAAGDPARALVLYAEAVEADPGNVEAERGRAHMLAALERHADAKLAYERVLTLAPEDVPARIALAENPSVAPAEQARFWLSAGDRQTRSLDAEGARNSFERAMQGGGEMRMAAKRHLARLEETLGNDLDAMAAWDEAAAADAGDLEALRGLGRLRARTGDAAGAEDAFARVVEAAPDDVPALRGLGDALLAQGKAEAAVAPLELAVAEAPQNVGGRTSLARALVQTGDTDAALRTLDPESLPLEARSLVLSEAAEIHASRGELDAAQAALVEAVALEPDEPPLRSALAKVYRQAGDAEAANAQQAIVAKLSGAAIALADGPGSAGGQPQMVGTNAFATLAESFPQTTPRRVSIGKTAFLGLEPQRGWRAQLRTWLLPRAVDAKRLEAALENALRARFAIEASRTLDVPAERALAALRAGGTSRADVALLNDRLGVDAAFLAHWVTPKDATLFDPPVGPVSVELRMLGGRREAEVFLSGYAATLVDPSAFVVWNWRAGVCALGLLVLLALPLLRGWGSLAVQLDYEQVRGSQGFFSIELSRRPGRTKQAKDRAGRSKRAKYQRRNRPWSRLVRHMVGRETRMSWIPARSWYVAVHGLLQETSSQEVIGNYLEERQVRIQRGKTTEVAFDFRRKAAPIEVRVQREESETAPIRVAVLGEPDSLRFVKENLATVFLGKGTHTLLVGVEDRVFERKVEVRDMTGQAVIVQSANTEDARFTGSPEAVDAYLGGDLLTASQALERAGQGEQALLMRAAHHRMRGEADEAAQWLERAGRFGEAAELASQSPKAERSAALYEKAGDFRHAAEQHQAAGDPLAAARAFEAAFDYAAAIEAYRNAGEFERALALLEKTGRFYEAGTLALEIDEEDTAIRCFQLVGVREPEYADACDALAGLFEKRDEFDLAIDKARAAIETKGADEAPLDALGGLARLFERAERPAEALAIWESIRKRDFQYAGAGERVESLRQTVAATARASEAHGAGDRTATLPVTPAAEGAREERYEVISELGRGGMGVVLRARDTRLGRMVALKRLPENLKNNATAVQLFLREARAAASLSHPNIVTLFDADQQPDGTYYLTMELLEGFPLDGVIKKRGRLSVRDTLRIGVQIAKGLQFAHENGVVHRDIKTANLFFTKDRVVKIMDFGLAKMTEEVRRSATVIGGTPYYMAPEQAAGDKVDHRADLYAFGVTLFELLTGAVPFTEGDIAYHHRHTAPPDPRMRVSGVPDAMAELMLRLLAKAPAERPQTTAEVVRALEGLLAEQGHTAAVR